MSKKIVFKGYLDHNSGWDFGAPLVVVEPYLDVHEANNIGEVENIIEDYMIQLSLKESPRTDNMAYKESKNLIMEELSLAKNGSKRFQYFEREVIYSESSQFYDELEYKENKVY